MISGVRMQLNRQIALKIVQRASQAIGLPINVMNEKGVIIASSNPKRLQQLHTGAVLALREDRVVEIDNQLAAQWAFEAQPGINLPIHYLGQLVGVVGISGDPDEVRVYAELVKITTELIVEQYAMLEQERWDKRYKEGFILQLLKGNVAIEKLTSQARLFHLDLEQHYGVVILKVLQPSTEKLQQLMSYLESVQFLHTAIVEIDQIVVLLPLDTLQKIVQNKQFSQFLPTDEAHFLKGYKIAIGAYEKEGLPFPFNYQTALTTLNYGLTHFPKKKIYLFEKYRIAALLEHFSHSWQAEELLKPLTLLQQQEDCLVLQKSLQEYFLQNCDLAHSSEKLFIHPNTLRYRLNKIERITGLHFNNVADKFVLYLSTLLSRI